MSQTLGISYLIQEFFLFLESRSKLMAFSDNFLSNKKIIFEFLKKFLDLRMRIFDTFYKQILFSVIRTKFNYEQILE